MGKYPSVSNEKDRILLSKVSDTIRYFKVSKFYITTIQPTPHATLAFREIFPHPSAKKVSHIFF